MCLQKMLQTHNIYAIFVGDLIKNSKMKIIKIYIYTMHALCL